MIKHRILCVALILLALFGGVSAQAEAGFIPYNSYLYNAAGDAVAVPPAYEADGVVNGQSLGVGAMTEPADLVVYNNIVYISDSGNNRILVLNDKLKLVKTIDKLSSGDSEDALNGPRGLFVDADGLYVCDTGNQRVLKLNDEGEILQIIRKPEAAEFPQSVDFQPQSLVADKSGNLYVLSQNIYQGAVIFDKDGHFSGYFGASQVQPTMQVLSQMIFERFMTKEQKEKLPKYVPTEFQNLTIRDDFIYTVTDDENRTQAIRKFNPKGKNIAFSDREFGDLDTYYDKTIKQTVSTQFIDICVDEGGYIYALDATYGKIFLYDSQFQLLFVFGGTGEQQGTFQAPTALERLNDSLLVLDSRRGLLCRLKPTDFFSKVCEANRLYNQGMYDKATQPWRDVLSQCNWYEKAYTGLGKVELGQYHYAQAMQYFRTANDTASYSEAFQYYRMEVVQNHFTAIAIGLILLVALIIMISKFFIKPIRNVWRILTHKLPERVRSRLQYPFLTMAHPFSGFEDMRNKEKSSYILAAAALMFWFASQIVREQGTGFIFRTSGGDFQLAVVLARTGGAFLLFVVANLGLRTFLAGRGGFRDICCAAAYAMLPYSLCSFAAAGVSHLLIAQESFILSAFTLIGWIWSSVMLVAGMKGVHEYELGRSLVSILLTLVGALLILFLCILFFSSIQQVVDLFMSMINEVRYRM